MAITIIVTNAGRDALVNAANTGTNAVTITQLGITATAFAADPAQVALPGEIKRIASVAGVVVADDAIHVTASDVTADAYTMRGFALYLADGTLFALYGQAGAILNKTAESMMLLAADIAFADIDATMIEFGDTNFVLPPATTEILGLVELATTAEGQGGSDNSRVLTPYVGKQAVLGWLLSQDGAGSGLDADLLDGLHASAFALAGHTHGTMATQNANAVAITGGTLGNVSVGVVDGTAASPGLFWNADTDTGLFRAAANALAVTTAGTERMRVGPDGKVTLNGATANYLLNVAAANPARGIIADFANVHGAPNGAQISFTQNGIANWCIGQLPGASAFSFYRDRNGAYDGSEVFRIAASGEFSAIGGATLGNGTGTRRLNFSTSRADLTITADGETDGAGSTIGYSWANGGQGPLKFSNSSGEVMRLGGNSFVGIGTVGEAAYLLEVAAPAAGGGALQTVMQIKSKSDAANNAVELRFAPLIAGQSRTAIGARREGATSHAALFFAAGGAERLTLDTSGNLVPTADGTQILGWPSARFRQGHFSEYVRIGGFDAWHNGNDGSGSGLDADLLDGLHASYFLPSATFSAAEILSRLLTVDGPGSGLNADLLDGLQASDFLQIAAASVLQNGYIAFSNGLKIIWGRVSVSMDSYSNVTYPISFDSVPTPVFPTIDQIGTASQQNTLLASSTISGFSIYQAGDISGTLPYHVIGK